MPCIRRSAIGFVLLAAAALLGHAVTASAQDAIAEGPVAYTAHGALFDAAGNEIEPTPAFIARAQDYYRRQLLRFAPQALQRQEERLRGDVVISARSAGVAPANGRAMANAAALELLMNRISPPSSDRLYGKLLTLEAHRAMQEFASQRPTLRELPNLDLPQLEPRRPVLRPRLDPTLQQVRPGQLQPLGQRTRLERTTTQALIFATTAQGQAYRDQCAAAGVPIPPDWGRPEWISQGELTAEFISAGFEAEVFTYASEQPEGMCIALPRWNTSDRAQFLGIICLSKRWSKACFWDNQTGSVQFFPERGVIYPLSAFGGGADLTNPGAGRCTECHAGQNPYVIHPNTALGLPQLAGLPLFPDDWYEPIVRPEWPQNPGPLSSSGACSACHTTGGTGGAFPIISRDLSPYCNNVLSIAITRTMPPGAGGSLQNDPHPDALLDMCDDDPPDQDVVVGGVPSTTPSGLDGFGTASDVYVIRSNDGSRQRLWGTLQYADVTATANAYCQGLGSGVAASWQANSCGEDESSYMRFNLDTDVWESKRSGSRNNPPGECLYALLSQVTCSP